MNYRYYDLTYAGRLRPGFDLETSVRRFAAAAKMSEDKARRLLSSGQPVVLSRDLDANKAERYRKLLEQLGLSVWVEPVDQSRSPLSVSQMGKHRATAISEYRDRRRQGGQAEEQYGVIRSGRPAQPEAEPASTVPPSVDEVCPKCGSTNVVDRTCRDCGILVHYYHVM